ncbi:hypothetical protein JTB14_031567 [Gonioctena quinquepunctata]|nr:hypothetical protein JTB14_031567 [Gonioctena quinquepunctata]
MSVISYTGLAKVFHSINFQPETLGKGKDLVNAGHVINVEEHRESGVGIFIRADVIRRTSVTKREYLVELHINAARQITSVSCDCVYGNSYECKHVAALIEFVNNDKSESKTNHEQLRGTHNAKKQKLEKYAKGVLFPEMYPSQGDLEIEQFEVQLSELNIDQH